MTQAFVAGLSLGLAAGVAPGPLQALIVTATLRRGFGAGWRVAIAPLLTDAVIVGLSIAVLSALPDRFLTTLGVAGGLLLVAMGIAEIVRSSRVLDDTETAGSGDLVAGAVVNVTNPHPWIFWIAAGGPLVVSLWRTSPSAALAFLVPFYVALVGSKVALAGAVALLRHALDPVWRRRLVVAGGALLVIGGVIVAVGFAR